MQLRAGAFHPGHADFGDIDAGGHVPALGIAAIVLMGVLLGVYGAVLAMPLTAAVFVLVKKLYIEDALGDPDGVANPGRPAA